jgi:hypothetical protein
MPWAKIDDGFTDHPKVVAAGPLASWLFVCGLTYSARLLTDGFIPTGQVRKLADVDGAMELAERLVTVGLWERCEGGFRIHDYLDYNPSKAQVLHTREVRAEAGSRGGKQKASNALANSQTFAKTFPKQNSTPSRPVSPSRIDPVPDPAQEDEAPAALARENYSEWFEQFWAEYPRGHGNKVKTYAAWKGRDLDKPGAKGLRAEVMAGLAAWKTCDRWQRGMIKAADIWVRDRWWRDPIPDESARASPGNRLAPITSEADAIRAKLRAEAQAIETTWRTR